MDKPWSDEQARWIFQKSAMLRAQGAIPVGSLVEPTAAFFPDAFDGSADAILAMLRRMLGHAGLDFVKSEVVRLDPEGGTSSCSSGACAPPQVVEKLRRVERIARGDTDAIYRVSILSTEAKNPFFLSAALGGAVGAMFLHESEAHRLFAPIERKAAAELAAIHLGLGLMILNGASVLLRGCGGAKTHGGTTLSLGEAALGLAIGAKLDPAPEMFRHATPSVKDALAFAFRFVEGNAGVIKRFEGDAASIARGDFVLREPRRSLLTILGFGKKNDDDDLETIALIAASSARKPGDSKRSAEKEAELRELRALVDEAFDR